MSESPPPQRPKNELTPEEARAAAEELFKKPEEASTSVPEAPNFAQGNMQAEMDALAAAQPAEEPVPEEKEEKPQKGPKRKKDGRLTNEAIKDASKAVDRISREYAKERVKKAEQAAQETEENKPPTYEELLDKALSRRAKLLPNSAFTAMQETPSQKRRRQKAGAKIAAVPQAPVARDEKDYRTEWKQMPTEGKWVLDPKEGLKRVEGSERTRKEWYGKLRELVGTFFKREKHVKMDYIGNRVKELDKDASTLEHHFRKWGQAYDKLGPKTKLAVGLSLGVAAGVSGAFSLPLAYGLCLGGIAVQRVVGLSSNFQQLEKKAPDGKRKKEKALGKAMLRSAAMTGGMVLLVDGIKEAVEYLRSGRFEDMYMKTLDEHPLYEPMVAQAPDVSHVSVAPADTVSAAHAAESNVVEPPEGGVPLTPAEMGMDAIKVHSTYEAGIRVTDFSYHGDPEIDGGEVRLHVLDYGNGKIQAFTGGEPYDIRGYAGGHLTQNWQAEVAQHSANPVLDNTMVMVQAKDLGIYEDTLRRLMAEGQGNSPAADTLRNLITKTVTEGNAKFGDVFQMPTDLTVGPEASAAAVSATNVETPPPPAQPTPDHVAPSAEAPSAQTPAANHSAPEAGTAVHINALGCPVDTEHAKAYLDIHDQPVIFGGSAEQMRDKAIELVSQNHKATAYFGVTEPGDATNGFKPVHHLYKAYWFDGSGKTADLVHPSDIEVHQPVIVDERVDPALRGVRIPSVDDLKKPYQP